MTHDKKIVYDEPSNVRAMDGCVAIDGPDDVAIALTPEAAEETSERLAEEAVKAAGQRRLRNYPHRGQDE